MSHIDLAPNAHRPDQDAINDVACELYETFMQPSDPEWNAEDDDVRADYVAHAIRLIDTYIAKAPKAWAVYMPDGTPFYVTFSTQPPNKYLVGREYFKRVALVEIPEEK